MEKSVSLFNLCNLENVFQKNLRTGMARECIFRASGDLRFKNFPQPWWRKGGGGEFQDVTSLPKKTLDSSLQMGHSFWEIAKNSAQGDCFKKFVWLGNFPQ